VEEDPESSEVSDTSSPSSMRTLRSLNQERTYVSTSELERMISTMEIFKCHEMKRSHFMPGKRVKSSTINVTFLGGRKSLAKLAASSMALIPVKIGEED